MKSGDHMVDAEAGAFVGEGCRGADVVEHGGEELVVEGGSMEGLTVPMRQCEKAGRSEVGWPQVMVAREELGKLVLGREGGADTLVGFERAFLARRDLVESTETGVLELVRVGRYKPWGGGARQEKHSKGGHSKTEQITKKKQNKKQI